MPNPERDVAVLLTDMCQYARRIDLMTPEQIRDFVVDYQLSLQAMVMQEDNGAQEFEPSAGDGAEAIFERRPGEGEREECRRALRVAIDIAKAVDSGKIPFTRIGIFAGKIIRAQFGESILKFGRSFAAASRLEELCAFFGTTILMDRDIALAQDAERKYLVAVGKVTPKNFNHPIHVYSIYKPGIHNCPLDIDEKRLLEFIRLKNDGIEHFVGNDRIGIYPDFKMAFECLDQAAVVFKEITGTMDLATSRILDYIRDNPYPMDTFDKEGMYINDKQGISMGIRLMRLSQELFKAVDYEVYHTLVEDTHWSSYFKTDWIRKGETIIRAGEKANGIYYIVKGQVGVVNAQGRKITDLAEGAIFGEMAYFSEGKKHTETMIANTDIVVRVIAAEDLQRSLLLQKLFSAISARRSPLI